MAKKKIRYYLCSVLCTSGSLHEFIKNLAIREKTSYRTGKPLQAMTARDKRLGREKVTEKKKIHIMTPDGPTEKEIEIVFYDEAGWRYYVEFSELMEYNEFMAEINETLELAAHIVEPGDDEEFHCESVEGNFGVDALPEGSYILYFDDAFLEEDGDFEFMGEHEGDEEGEE